MEISFLVFDPTLREFVSLMITNCNSKINTEDLSPFYIFRILATSNEGNGVKFFAEIGNATSQLKQPKCLECVCLFRQLNFELCSRSHENITITSKANFHIPFA